MTKTSLRKQIEARKATEAANGKAIQAARFFRKDSPFRAVWDGSRLPEDQV